MTVLRGYQRLAAGCSPHDISAPNLTPDKIGARMLRERTEKERNDPAFRAHMQFVRRMNADKAQITRGRRDVKVSLPKFSWDGEK